MEEVKEGRQGRGSRRLTWQISSECVHCVGFRWPTTTILGKFWGLMCRPPFTDEGQVWYWYCFRGSVRLGGKAGFGVLHASQLVGHAARLLYLFIYLLNSCRGQTSLERSSFHGLRCI